MDHQLRIWQYRIEHVGAVPVVRRLCADSQSEHVRGHHPRTHLMLPLESCGALPTGDTAHSFGGPYLLAFVFHVANAALRLCASSSKSLRLGSFPW
jgi:hypothetical protein